MAVVLETIVDVSIEGAILQQLDSMHDSVLNPPADVTETRQPIYLGLFVLAQ